MLVRFYLKLGLPSKRFPCQTNTNIKKFISQFWQRNILWLKSIKCTIAHVRNLWNINYNQCIRKMMVRAMMQTMSVNFGCALFIVFNIPHAYNMSVQQTILQYLVLLVFGRWDEMCKVTGKCVTYVSHYYSWYAWYTEGFWKSTNSYLSNCSERDNNSRYSYASERWSKLILWCVSNAFYYLLSRWLMIFILNIYR